MSVRQASSAWAGETKETSPVRRSVSPGDQGGKIRDGGASAGAASADGAGEPAAAKRQRAGAEGDAPLNLSKSKGESSHFKPQNWQSKGSLFSLLIPCWKQHRNNESPAD